jgi:hypothetical protein
MKCCETYAAALSAFADGELSEDEAAALLAHIEACDGCREHLSELMTLHAVLGELPELEPPRGFAEAVLARVHEEEAEKKRRRAVPRVLAACAALVLLSAAALRLAPLGGSDSADTVADAETSGDENGAASSTADGKEDSRTCFTLQENGDDAFSEADGAPNADAQTGYPTVRVTAPGAADFLAASGMAVYDETEESVSYLVTPEVAHELAAGLASGETAALLSAVSDLTVIEVEKPSSAPAEAQGEEQSEAQSEGESE